MAESDFSHVLRSHFRGEPPSPDEHPSPEELVAYRHEKLDPQDAAAIRAHLLACEECRELLLELAALENEPAAASAGASEIEVEAAWKRQRKRLLPHRRPSLPTLGGWLAAACLALVAAGLTLEMRKLQRSATEIAAFDPPRVVAAEAGQRELATESLPRLALEPDRLGIILLLLDDGKSFSSFRAEFFSGATAPILVRDGLSGADDFLIIQVTQDLLPAGEYRVVVSGWLEDHYEKVREYGLRVRHVS